MTQNLPILITEEHWANSHFSIARYTGEIKINGHRYVIVNKHGKDIYECSAIAERTGRNKAIEPGEPADLCLADFIPIYRQLGREKFISFLKEHPEIRTAKAARDYIKTHR